MPIDKPDTHTGKVFLEDGEDVFYNGFDPYFKFDTFDVRRRLVPSSGLYEYKARGIFSGTEYKCLLAVYLDFEYRKTWDALFHSGDMLAYLPDSSPAVNTLFDAKDTTSNGTDSGALGSPASDSGVEFQLPVTAFDKRLHKLTQLHARQQHYHYTIKMPFPLTNRDYVYVVRAWSESPTLYLVEGKGTTHTAKPEVKSAIRIEDYYQQIAVKPTADGKSTMLALRYYDDPKGTIPTSLINYAAQKGVPSFVKSLSDACEKYNSWLATKSV